MINIRILKEKELIGPRVIPLSFNQLCDLYKDNPVYLRIPNMVNNFNKSVKLNDMHLDYLKTFINKETIVDILKSLNDYNNMDYYNNEDFLNIVLYKSNYNRPYNPNDERALLNMSFEFMISNKEQKEQAELLIKNIHKEIKYLRDKYTYIFTLSKPKNRKRDRIIINIKNYNDEDTFSIIDLISNLGEEYCKKSPIFNTLTYALMSNYNFDFIEEDEFKDIERKAKIKNAFI
ncbi:hypothetical protein CPT_Machias_041 [Staphylococcus phage Machias]|nr:hypothetical protein CPT_Machias_041 [Staphylococcus phage Machias]